MAGSLLKSCMNNSIHDFHVRQAPKIIPVCWHPPRTEWIKCNSSDVAHGTPGPTGFGSLFYDSNGVLLGVFVKSRDIYILKTNEDL